MTSLQRMRSAVAAAGPLAWLAVAWLLGPLPGGPRGVTGQSLATVWFWHLAVLVVALHWLLRGRGRPGAVPAADSAWLPGRRWWTVVVVGWAALAVLTAAQAVTGQSGWGPTVTFAAAAVGLATGAWRTVGATAVARLAGVGVLLAAAAVGTFVAAAGLLDGPAGFYAVKERVVVPGAAHNLLAGLLLVGAAAVCVQSLRAPRWRWAVPLVGLGLGATLSRGALVAGAVAVVVAAVVLRDRALARRLALVTGTAALLVTGVLLAFGAALPSGAEQSSVAARVELWDVAIEIAAEAPLVGAGADGLLDEPRMAASVVAHEHAHNLLLHSAASTGLLGLLATAAVWGGVLVGAWGLVDRDRRNVVVAGVAALGAHAMVDEVAFRPVTVGLLLLLALTVAAPLEPGPGRGVRGAGGAVSPG